MNLDELKAISEPPPGSLVEIHTNYSQAQHFRRFEGIGWINLDNFHWNGYGEHKTVTWESITNGFGVHRAFLWERQGPSAAPADMQEGKRYRVVFEGIRNDADCGCCWRIVTDTEALDGSIVECATHIEEIGGDS